MHKIIQFGETVEGYNIPVLNEREIRAAAGILFLLMFTSVMVVILTENFLLLNQGLDPPTGYPAGEVQDPLDYLYLQKNAVISCCFDRSYC